jgi:DNA-binding transcriptional MerR regulator
MTGGLLIGEVAARSGLSRKALRLYEAAGILPPPRRTGAGYRLYGRDALRLLSFVAQARRLGLSIEEIKNIVAIRRSGRAPCAHVRRMVATKAAELDQVIADARELRGRIRRVLRSWPAVRKTDGVVCPHIETTNGG